jgi:hypothetical protein
MKKFENPYGFDFCAASLREIGPASIEMMAERGWLRIKAYGRTQTYGDDAPFFGNRRRAARALIKSIREGFLALYEDEQGVFVGPVSPFHVDEPFNPQDCIEGAVQ